MYGIILKTIEIYDFQIEADSEEEAKYIAETMLENGEHLTHHDDSDSEIEVYDI